MSLPSKLLNPIRDICLPVLMPARSPESFHTLPEGSCLDQSSRSRLEETSGVQEGLLTRTNNCARLAHNRSESARRLACPGQ
jgi:hypothetical protein